MKTEYTVACLFGGIGGGALGFEGARAEYMGKLAKFKTICSIDADPIVCQNYEMITGGKAVQMDLFDRAQYTDFFGKEPSADWHEAEPWDIWQAFGEQVPDVIFTSPPCKGFSGLLPEKSAASKKYQALNLLTIRGIDITLAACRNYGGELPALFLLENVPRIMTRGKKILERIKSTLKKYGYAVSDESHDCGEIGGLGQHRKRYLLIARNEKKMPAFVYKPEVKPLKTIGDVIGHLPLPGDVENGGPMHRVPMLQRKTWERLAFIPAGGDWRDLEHIEFEKYCLQLDHSPRNGAWAVEDWDKTSRTVTGGSGVGQSNGVSAIADPRTGFKDSTHRAIYRVSEWDEEGPTVTGAHRPNNGAICIADPRLHEKSPKFNHAYKVTEWEETAGTVAGSGGPSNGAHIVADPRLGCSPRSGSYGVQDWNETATTVTGSGDIHSGNAAVADPRIPTYTERCVMVIIALDGTWHRPLTTLELAALQGFPMQLSDGRPFQLEGCSDAKAREYIGNAVPPDAARGMANVILMAMVMSETGITFEFGHQDIWVVPQEDRLPAMVH